MSFIYVLFAKSCPYFLYISNKLFKHSVQNLKKTVKYGLLIKKLLSI